ncbi:MAG: IPT/TIG domain-containing protein, partial [Rhodocyclaceae bacterium]|nr:IPT/TIG domain-containing protein [Rhodocyclaceae bacterium]
MGKQRLARVFARGSSAPIALPIRQKFAHALVGAANPRGLRRTLTALFVPLLVAFSMLTQPARADIQYSYDEVGRLVQIIDSNGESAQYQYDAAGNITAITRTGSAQISIAEFSPSSGPVGSQVTIDGVGFSTTPSNNSVKFNGVTAVVVSATGTRLVATVPASATTGPLTVTVGGNTATATTPFTVATDQMNPPPVVVGVSPTIGAVGTAVTVTGQNFDAVAINNKVRFNGALAPISSASPLQLIATVPAAATSGRIAVGTPYGTASSTQDFFVLPSGYTVAQIGSTARLAVDGAPLALNSGASGQLAMMVFDGVQGQNVSITISSVGFTPTNGGANFYVKAPDGSTVGSNYSLPAQGTIVDLPTLPANGTYTLVVVPGSGTSVNATYAVSGELTGPIAIDGAPVSFSTTRIGQNGRYSFSGAVGQKLGLGISALSTTPSGGTVAVTVYAPDNVTVLMSCGSYSATGGNCNLPALPSTGTYTVQVNPSTTYG